MANNWLLGCSVWPVVSASSSVYSLGWLSLEVLPRVCLYLHRCLSEDRKSKPAACLQQNVRAASTDTSVVSSATSKENECLGVGLKWARLIWALTALKLQFIPERKCILFCRLMQKKKKNECLLLVPEKKFISGYWSNFVPFLDTQHSSSSVNVSEMSSDLRQ